MRQVTGGDPVGWVERMPCMTGGDEERAHCAGYQAPTKEELEAQEAEFEQMFKAVRIARGRIVEASKTAMDKAGVVFVTCPVCGGELRGSVASNGHVHGHCSMAGCLRWME